MSSVVALTGTARPRPIPASAVLTPTSRACESTSAPPELPGFNAASVWITFSTTRPPEGKRASERRHDAGGHGAGEPMRVPHGDDQLAHPEHVGVAELHLGQARGGDAQHGQVGQGVAPDQFERRLVPVGEDRRAALGAGDHVGRSQQVPVGVQHHRTAGALAAAGGDAQRGDRGDDVLGDRDHDLGVGVESLSLIWCRGLGRGGIRRRRSEQLGHIKLGPPTRTCSTPARASRSSASQSAWCRSTNLTHHASASLRLRAIPASMSRRQYGPLTQAQPGHDGRSLRGEERRGAVALDAPRHRAPEA